MLKAHLKDMPTTLAIDLDNQYDRGWIVIYTQMVAPDDWTVMGKVLLRYSEDFCGGLEVRSCYTVASKVKSDGWSRDITAFPSSMVGEGPLEDRLPNYTHYARLSEWPEDCTEFTARKTYLKSLVLGALAARVLAYASESHRNGIIGRDRVGQEDSWGGDVMEDGEVIKLLQQVARMSGWCNWRTGHAYGVSSVYYPKWRRSTDKTVRSLGFHNYNSERNVGVFVCANFEDTEGGYEDDDWDDEDSDFSQGYGDARIGVQNDEYAVLFKNCPKESWCVG